MKNYFTYIFFLLLLALVTQAQTSQGYLASYDLTFNNSRPSVITSDMYIESSQEQTLSIWRRDTRRSLKEELPDPIKDSGNEFRVTVGTGKNRYHYYDSKKDSIYSIVSIFRDRYVVQEAKPTIAWDLNHKEAKKIGDYTAKKATCYFRGRNYTAWYTPEVPINYGPFKFHGLPGLILDIRDETQTYVWQLRSFLSAARFPKIEDIKELHDLPKIDNRTYIDKKYKNRQPINLAEVNAKLPRDVRVHSVKSIYPKTRSNIETKFEWEEESEKE